ncbi:hypothetical protein MAR_006510 [Mya arenaria]|uniref:Uncharacterized protein n=1 Tax=Mya arenaria TaxID=6604 RepID=A0ABY7DCD3_MYAAR|nr:hypothetical protein MAR_006510 [Mya arenaria]
MSILLTKRMQSIMDILKSRQGKSESRREIKNPEFTIDTNNEASCNEDVQLLPETTLLIGDSILKNTQEVITPKSAVQCETHINPKQLIGRIVIENLRDDALLF